FRVILDIVTTADITSPLELLHDRPVVVLEEYALGSSDHADVVQGTLDLMVLKTLDSLGPMHGYGIAQRIVQMSGSLLSLNQGSLYPALLRLEQRGWIRSRAGVSDNNRRARYYSVTPAGR